MVFILRNIVVYYIRTITVMIHIYRLNDYTRTSVLDDATNLEAPEEIDKRDTSVSDVIILLNVKQRY